MPVCLHHKYLQEDFTEVIDNRAFCLLAGWLACWLAGLLAGLLANLLALDRQ